MPGRLPRRSWLTIALTLLITLQSPAPAWAWGRLGHRVISRLAKKHMTEKARDALADLLEPNETIADASTWADAYRGTHRETAPWHYVDVSLDEPRYDSKWSADDPKKGCVVDKINKFMATLKDKSKPVEECRFALRFLNHCGRLARVLNEAFDSH
jgi:nuclease S1